jgi:hypothetical protein
MAGASALACSTTTYIFMLTPETETTLKARILYALNAEFPEHVFEAGRAVHPEFHDSILPIIGAASTDADKPSFIVEPDKVEVAQKRLCGDAQSTAGLEAIVTLMCAARSIPDTTKRPPGVTSDGPPTDRGAVG